MYYKIYIHMLFEGYFVSLKMKNTLILEIELCLFAVIPI